MPGHVHAPILSRAEAGVEATACDRAAPQRLTAALVSAMTILAGEILLPPALSLGCLYMLLAAYTALRLRESQALVVLTFTCVGGGTINYIQLFQSGGVGWEAIGVELWNDATRLITICVFAVVLRRLVLALSRERQRAERDPLTGALNRRAMLERLPGLAASAMRGRTAVGMAYIDLDGFKQVNDRHGHGVGDALLCRFAFAAATMLEESEVFARVGGDEFVVVLPGADRATLEQRMLALQARLAAALDEMDLGVTCSIGAIVADGGKGLELAPLIERADRLMYQVKKRGKNGLRIIHRLPDGAVIDGDWPLANRAMRMAAGRAYLSPALALQD